MAVAVPTHARSPIPADLALRTDDDGLVARVRAGDETAFDTVYERHHRKLLAFCRHMVGSREEAEDVLQHTFVAAYRALLRTDEPVALRPWLFTIARNRCLSTLRARTPETDLDGAESELRSYDGLAAEVHRRTELRDLVDDIKVLPEQQRAALVLFELGDHSHEEIAVVLGVRREKVKALVFQAREGLMRARRGREASCHDIRRELASTRGAASKRSVERLHVDRCPACAAYAADVRRQRVALAAVMPVVPSLGLKSSVLGSILGGGGIAAAGGGAAGGGAAAVTAGSAGGAGASAGGASMVSTGALGGGATAAGAGAGAGGAAAGAAAGTAAVGTAAGSTAGGLAVAGGVVAAEAGTAGGLVGGLAGLGVQGVVAKVLTVVAVAGGAGGATAVGVSERRAANEPSSSEVAERSASSAAPAGAGAPAAAGAQAGLGSLAPVPPATLTPVVFEAPAPAAAEPAPAVPADPGAAPSLPPAAGAPAAPADQGTPAPDAAPGDGIAVPVIPIDSTGSEPGTPGDGPTGGNTTPTETEPPAANEVPGTTQPDLTVTEPPLTTPDPTVTPPDPTPGADQPPPGDPVTTPPVDEQPPGGADPGPPPADPPNPPGAGGAAEEPGVSTNELPPVDESTTTP